MEGDNTQKSTSEQRIFETMMHTFEHDMEDLPNEKKEEILNIFKNHSQLNQETEFNEIKNRLHETIKKGDTEYIKILLGKKIINDTKDMEFRIDEPNKTASLIKVSQNLENVIVPRNVKYKLNNYLVTSISSLGFSISNSNSNIKTIKFEDDSAVRTFYKSAFAFSKVEEIHFPNSLTDLKEGWCCATSKLKRIIILESNDRFIYKDDKYLLGKSDNKSDDFDILLFVRRDINEVSLPLNIKIIDSCSFYNSQIRRISIPASVTKICESAFFYCRNIQIVEFPENSNLQIICDNAFSNSNLNAISIPSSVSRIGQNAFSICRHLKEVEIPKNSNLQAIEKDTFSYSGIEEIFIPASVKKIGENAFSDCNKLKRIEIPTNSNLQVISSGAFIWTMIEEIYFPERLIELKDYWCCSTRKLKRIVISSSNDRFVFKYDKYLLAKSDNNSDVFDTLLFVRRDINEISLPSDIKIIGSCSCELLSITDVSLPPNVEIIGPNSFSSSNIKQVLIPSSVTKICNNAFSGCENLTKVEFSRNSNLQTIEESAFSLSKIEEISLPPSVSKICTRAFSQCYNLTKCVFPVNIKIEAIEVGLFEDSYIVEISIPQSVTAIFDNAFGRCKNLRKIEIPTNSNLKTIGKGAFSSTEIEEIYFPKSLIELKEGWCYNVNKLKKITISPSNDRFIFKDDKYLLGKSDNNGDDFDILLFVRRDITEISLPLNIKIIGSGSFYNSQIHKIVIPASVTKICESAFHYCNLRKLEISDNSNLQTIEDGAFQSSKINQFCFPSSMSEIGHFSFSYCNGLKMVEISENTNIQSIPETSFHSSNPIVMIPSSLRKLVQEDDKI